MSPGQMFEEGTEMSSNHKSTQAKGLLMLMPPALVLPRSFGVVPLRPQSWSSQRPCSRLLGGVLLEVGGIDHPQVLVLIDPLLRASSLVAQRGIQPRGFSLDLFQARSLVVRRLGSPIERRVAVRALRGAFLNSFCSLSQSRDPLSVEVPKSLIQPHQRIAINYLFNPSP